MEKEEYIELLKDKLDTNFIGLAITPWHSLGIDSAYKYLKNQNIELKGFIFIYSHPKTGKCLKKDSISSNLNIVETNIEKGNNKSKINTLKSLLKYFKELNKKKEIIYIVCPSHPNWFFVDLINTVYPKKKVLFVIISEGIGDNKLRKKEFFLRKYSREECNILVSIYLKMKALIDYKLNEYFIKNIININCLDDLTLFKESNMKTELDCRLIPCYKETLIDRSKRIKKLGIYRNAILYNASIVEDYGNGSIDYDVEEILKISNYSKEKIVVKSHPRDTDYERFMKIGCIVDIRNEYSQEELIAAEDNYPVCVIGINSTTLITIKLLYNIPTFSIAKILLKETNDKEFQESLKEYINEFDGIVNMPNNYEELFNSIILE